jgi:ribosome-binding factor A
VTRLRAKRVAEAIRSEVADILAREMKDPRLGFATVTDVEVSGDLRHVKIFVSVMGDEAQVSETMAALESAQGFIRAEMVAASEGLPSRFIQPPGIFPTA